RETHDGHKRTNGRRERLGPYRLDGRMEDTLRWLGLALCRKSPSLDLGLQFRLYRRAELGEPRFHASLPYAVLGRAAHERPLCRPMVWMANPDGTDARR